MQATLADAFAELPTSLREDLLSAFNEIVRNYREGRWEPSELNGGKLCEAVYTVVAGRITGTYEPRSKKPRNMVSACQALEQDATADRSLRIQIPRVIVALYEIRNNRGVGHAGGDVDPNQMDATLVLYMAKWLMGELVRVLHSLSTEAASEVVEGLVEREMAFVWSHEDIKRVLHTGLTRKQQTLVLLASEHGEVAEDDLRRWLEHTNKSALRRDVLRPLHKARLIEFNAPDGKVRLLPPGVAAADEIVARLGSRSTAAERGT